jgi:hypothetical protein
MSEQVLGTLSAEQSDGETILIDLRAVEAARRSVVAAKLLTPAEREQLACDIADIEVAAAALRKGQPALKS